MVLPRLAQRMLHSLHAQVRFGVMALGDPLFYALAALGLSAWLIPQPRLRLPWDWLLQKALLEEFIFRFLVLEALDRRLSRTYRLGPISLANVVASACFSGMHLFRQPPLWALLTFFPSLIFGFAWERYRSIVPCWLIHFFYNFCLFHRFA